MRQSAVSIVESVSGPSRLRVDLKNVKLAGDCKLAVSSDRTRIIDAPSPIPLN